MIIVSITGPGMHEALSQVASSVRYADMFEFRLDLIRKPNIARLVAATKKPTIATCRPDWEGGAFRGAERERIEMLEMASAFGSTYVDIELNVSPRILQEFIRRRNDTKVIVSVHLFDADLFDVTGLYSALAATGADVIKLAYTADDASDCRHAFKFLALARAAQRKAVSIAIGECGEASRILYRKFGGWATYASPEIGKTAAPGQIPAGEMKNLYRANVRTFATKVYGVIGNPLRQSKGTGIHNPLFQGIRKNAVYCRFPVPDLEQFMKHMAPQLAGFSVTIPHKRSVMQYLHGIDPQAKAIGAVNTIIRRGSKYFGTNTDAPAALNAIEAVVKVKQRCILIVGAGGAARAIAYEAKRRGARVMITNRTELKARQLAVEFGIECVEMRSIRHAGFDIFVNATSVGMFPHIHRSPVPGSILKGKIVFDAVYNPPTTKLLRDAKRVGATVIPGTAMYLHQAALQSQLYTGVRPTPGVMSRLLERTFQAHD